jgi:hypothetical protein
MINLRAMKKETSDEYIPRSVNKARAWVRGLPITNLGETTRRLYMGLVDFNQSRISSVARIDIADTLHNTASLVLGNLQRHLVSRAFPLPQKSQRIFELKQSLLLELAGSYQLAAVDMITTASITKRPLLKAIYSAMLYLSEVLLQHYTVYAKTRDTLWHDMHHLYLLACDNGLQNMVVLKDNDGLATINDVYKYANLLALSNPYSLRQGEIERLEHLFHVLLPLVEIHPNADTIKTELSYIIHLNRDAHAALVPVSDILNSPTIRVLDLSELIKKLDCYISALENNTKPSKYYLFKDIGISLAKRLVFHFTRVRNRSAKRYVKNENISVVTGLSNVVTVLDNNDKLESLNNAELDDLSASAFDKDQNMAVDALYSSKNNSTSQSSKPNSAPTVSDTATPTVLMQTWLVTNSSVGGYGLLWRNDEPSAARVGSIVGLRSAHDAEVEWQIGTIRWIEFIKERGLCVGIEFLAPYVVPIAVKHINHVKKPVQNLPIAGLMLPPIEGIRPEPELLFPPQMFRTGDELQVAFSLHEETIRLTNRDECTGSFGIFGYNVVKKETLKLEDVIDEEDYSAIWGGL